MAEYLMLIFIFLIAGVVAVPIGTRLGLGSVLGYLLAGIGIAPVLAGLRVDVAAIQHVAEFGFVLLAFSVGNGVLTRALADQLLLVVALSMLLTPLLFILYDRVIAPRFAAHQRDPDEIDKPAEIIVAGHGRFGGIVNRMLRGFGYETVVVDYNAQQLEILRRFGVHVYYGDATRPDLLQAAGIERAKLFVIAIDDREQITRLARYVVENYPRVHVIARAWDRNHTYELWSVGCRDIIRETYDGAIRTGRSALEALGCSHEEAVQLAAAFERLDRDSMVELATAFRIDVPSHENPEFVEKYKAVREEWGRQLLGAVEEIRQGAAVQKPD